MEPRTAIAMIPARFSSTRLPGKPLADIDGTPLIQHVYRRVSSARSVQSILIATDDDRIATAVRAFGGTVVMTRSDHASGTDRLAEAAASLDPDTLVVNVQGDEPLIEPEIIDRAVEAASLRDAEVVTLMTPLPPDQNLDPNRVKVVTDRNGHALYFSRSPIPSQGPCYLHVGLYAYRAGFLRQLSSLERTPLEIAERLEQLRVLEHGFRIRVVEVSSASWGIDTPEDLDRYRALLRNGHAEHS